MFLSGHDDTISTDHGEVDKAGVELHVDLPVNLRLALLPEVLPDSRHTHCSSVIVQGDVVMGL